MNLGVLESDIKLVMVVVFEANSITYLSLVYLTV